MAVSKSKKKEVLESLSPVLKNSESVVFINFHGLSSNDANSFRKALKNKEVRLTVAKKTLVKKALEEAKIPGTMPELNGELALAYGADAILPASEVYSFQRKLDNKISILGGIFGGKFAGKDEMVTIAQIPPLPVLYGQFVNLINSPIQGFVMALSEIAKKKA